MYFNMENYKHFYRVKPEHFFRLFQIVGFQSGFCMCPDQGLNHNLGISRQRFNQLRYLARAQSVFLKVSRLKNTRDCT